MSARVTGGSDMSVNRRNVLLAGGGVAASLASSLASTNPASSQSMDGPTRRAREADIVVIGSGAAGTVAAIVAKESNASVILLEAQPHTGGTRYAAAAISR